MTEQQYTENVDKWDAWVAVARMHAYPKSNLLEYDEDTLINYFIPILKANQYIEKHGIANTLNALTIIKEILDNNPNVNSVKEGHLLNAAFNKIVHEGTWADSFTAVAAIGYISPSYVATSVISKVNDTVNAGIELVGNGIDYAFNSFWA